MRRRKRFAGAGAYLLCIGFILAAVWLCILGLVGMRTVKLRSGGIWLAAADGTGSLGADKIQSMREEEAGREEPIDFTAWSEAQETVMALDGCRRAQTTVVRLCGSSEQLIPYGKILQDWDYEGCLIGEETAEALFGSRKAAGLTVSCGGREYVVRGVLASPAKLLVIVDDTGNTSCDYITLAYDGKNAGSAAEGFLSRYGLSMQLMERAGFTGTFTAAELLPGKWSDFDGWKRNVAAWREAEKAKESIAPSVFVTEAEGKRSAAAGELAAGLLLLVIGIFKTDRTRRDL